VDILKVLYITLIRSTLEYASVVWNKLTLADSNKLENMKRKFANLCCNRFIQLNSFCNYESMLNYLYFKALYSRRRKLDASFLVNVFKNKTDGCSIMDAVRPCRVVISRTSLLVVRQSPASKDANKKAEEATALEAGNR
jgi:hypothetical protein